MIRVRAKSAAAVAAAVGMVSSVGMAVAGTADLGINLLGGDVNDTSAAWADVIRVTSTWGTLDAPWTANPSLQLTADGYPLQDASISSGMGAYPDGVYKLSFTGTAALTMRGLGTLTDLQRIGETTTADVVVNRAKSGGLPLIMNFTNLDPQDPLDNMHLMAPDSVSGQTYREPLVKRLQPFSTVRFMDWTQTNGNMEQSWSDRVQPDVYGTTAKGVTWENVAALANQAGKDPWINVPVLADDDYVRNLAQLMRQSLSSDRTVYVEFSNELWNQAFKQFGQNAAAAAANPALTDADTIGRAGQQAALRTKQIGDIFKQEFGADAGRVKVVLGGQAAWTYFLSEGLKYLQKTYGPVSNSIDAVAVAPYVALDSSLDVSTATVDQVFDSLDRYMDANIKPWIQNNAQLASQYGVPMMAYEGGQGIYTNGVNQSVMLQAQQDPRMGQLLERLQAIWEQNGGGTFAEYGLMKLDGRWGYWGALQYMTDPGSPRWDAMLRMALPAGDADLDGVLDTGDLSIILANLGKSGMWWEQGDFNADGVVNSDDLTIFDRGLARAGLYRMGAMVVPEPGIGVLAVAGTTAASLLRRRRRR